MAGINLSQALQEKQAKARGNFFDTSLYIILTILMLVYGGYWGVRWYLKTLESQIATAQEEITTKSSQLSGKEAERVLDMRDRLDMIEKNLETIPNSPKIFKDIETAILPSIQLTRYEEQWKDRKLMLEGVTDNIKSVAQLMLSLKKNPQIVAVAVKELRYNDEKKLEFALTAETNRYSEQK